MRRADQQVAAARAGARARWRRCGSGTRRTARTARRGAGTGTGATRGPRARGRATPGPPARRRARAGDGLGRQARPRRAPADRRVRRRSAGLSPVGAGVAAGPGSRRLGRLGHRRRPRRPSGRRRRCGARRSRRRRVDLVVLVGSSSSIGLVVVVQQLLVIEQLLRRRAAARPTARQTAPGRWRITSSRIEPTIAIAETSIAVGMPKKVQLSTRRVSSTNRTTAYQMRKIRNRSPGRIRLPNRRAIQSSVTAPDDAAQRLVQEQRLEARSSRSGYWEHGYSTTRWAQSIAMPHGRFVGGPYSSWLKKLPQPADGLHDEQAGRDDVGPLRERLVPAAGDVPRGDRAGDDPAVDAEAGVRRQDDLGSGRPCTAATGR